MNRPAFRRPPTAQALERIQAELAGEQVVVRRRRKPTTPLSAADLQATIAAFVQAKGSPLQTARLLCLHLNTVKYRLNVLRGRWGVPSASRLDLLLLAVRAGQDDPEDALNRFVLWAVSEASEEGPYFGPALRLWLLGTLDRWTLMQVDRARAEAAA